MKRKITILLLMVTTITQITACSLKPTCKTDGCDSTEIYQDGYCKKHYYEKVGENIINDLFNF